MEFTSAVSTYILSCYSQTERPYPTKVGLSWIPECGMGLFSTSPIDAGDILGCYHGDVLDTRSALRRKDKSYLMRLGEQCYVDSKETWMCLPRFINDCRNKDMYNVEFIKCPKEKCAWVRALRNIEEGEELYVDYGKWYWASLRPIRVSKGYIQEKIDALRVLRAREQYC